MPVFTPPLAYDSPGVLPKTFGVERSLFRYYGGNPRGLSVVGPFPTYHTVDNPYQDLLVGTEGVDYFLGGHVYAVTQAVSDALILSGYSTTADPAPPVRQLTWGALAGGTWADFTMNYGTWG